MATDFTNNNKTISASGGLQPTTINTPLDVRTRVNLKADIDSIPNPFVGMKILVLQDETNNNEMTEYVVVSLKADSLGIANAKINEVVLTKDFLGVNGNGITDEQAQQLNTAYTHSQSTHVQQSDIPTKTSQLTNDSDFATNASVDEKIANASTGGTVDLSSYAKKTDLPTKTSQLTNDSGFITSIPSEYVTEQELNTGLSAKANKSEIPTKTSQLTNDSGFLTQHQDISGKVDKISGKGLSTNDYTTEEKNKLNGIEENANNYSLPMASSTVLGGIKVGNGLSIDSNGVLSSNVPSLEGNALTFGNYTIKYNETDDTLDFIYNNTTEEPEVPPTTGDYVTEGLSLYIDARDVATQGSVRDITGKQSIVNHGVSTTLDNGCLNFVASESDYIDTGLVPNLSTWSAEIYFYYTAEPTSTEVVVGWGKAGDNNIRIAYSASSDRLTVQSNGGTNYELLDGSEILSLHHIIITMNNGSITSYVDGIKAVLCTDATVQSSHDGTLKIGSRYSGVKEFANMHLKTFRFYDGKVLSDEEALQNYNYETKINNYVTDGLSMYIDASDVTTYGSIRDITGKQNIVNHGVSTTLDNGCLNFVASESDYIDCGFKPNLTQWSTELYFYFTIPNTPVLLGWGASGNRTAIAIWDNDFIIAINDTKTYTIMPTIPTSLTHLVVTYNNGTIIVYANGVKSQLTISANVMSSQAGNLMLGTKYNASSEFGDIHLKSLRFYDGKALTDEEALQNYNYEINRNSSIIKPTWEDNKSIDAEGNKVDDTDDMITGYHKIDKNYSYTINYANVSKVRIFYYDSNKTYISRSEYLTSGSVDTLITFPENTAYFRIKAKKDTSTVEQANDNVILKKVLKQGE